MISDIVFDFFGTLVQYTPGTFHTAPYQQTHHFLQQKGFVIGYDAFTEAFAAGADTLEMEAKHSFREYHMHDVGRAFFHTTFGIEVENATLELFTKHFIREWSRGIVSIEGLPQLLDMLASRYRLSILSNTHYPALIHDNLATMEIAPYFSQIVTSVEVGVRKPHAAIFEHTLQQLALSAEQALYVGDTYIDDYQGATGASIRCVLIDPQNRYSNVETRINSVLELASFLSVGD